MLSRDDDMRDEVPSGPYTPYGSIGPTERFERLEGKVDGIALDVATIKQAMAASDAVASYKRWSYSIGMVALSIIVSAGVALFVAR